MSKSLHLCLFLLLLANMLSAASWYVKPGGSGSGNSCSNAASVNSLQTVVNAASAGDVIYLEPGTYSMTNAVNINKQLTFQGAGMGKTIIASGASALSPFSISAAGVIFKDMTIKDFSGTTSNAKAFYIKGTIDNQLTNIEFTNFPTGNVSEIVIVENVNSSGSPSAVGITFDGCWWHGMVASSIRSQGIAIRAANTTAAINVTVQNCVMTGMNNTNDHFPAGIYLVGGGSGLPSTCNLTVTNSVFSCLTGERGGAIGSYPSAGSNYPTINLTNCTFNNNTNPNANGAEGGGALDFQRGAIVTLNKCIFDGNKQTVSGSRGGAINMDNSGNMRMTISNCIFRNNTSTGAGSAIYFDDLSTAITNTMSNCLFHNNTANGGSTVTVAGSSSATLNISTCTFTSNKGSSATAGHALRVNTGTVNVSNTISYNNWTDGEDELSQAGGTASINTVNLEGPSVATAENTELGGTWTKTGTFVTDPLLDTNYEPTASGYPAGVGFRLNSLSFGGTPGQYDEDPGGSCPSRGFNYPTTTSLCIVPMEDTGSAPASGGVAIANIAANDQVNGVPATLGAGGNATVATSGIWQTGITLNTSTGEVSVAAGTPEGMYILEYTLCDKLTPPTCVTSSIIVTVSAPAPIVLIEFKAVKISDEKIRLNWSTATEKNNDYFEVERSINGIQWHVIARIQSKNGNSQNRQDYAFDDEVTNASQVYYRLKQVDLDGKHSNSSVVSLQLKQSAFSCLLFPNPATDALTIESAMPLRSVTIYSALTGQLILQHDEADPVRTIQVQFEGMAAGVYQVIVQSEDRSTYRKLIQVR